jgi:two-component system, OmpR family, phosphate regulon sensor histidine kinase PhoR
MKQRNNLSLIRVLMILAILAIILFQGYWLRENYNRERKSLELKLDVAFKEAFFLQMFKQVQTAKQGGNISLKVSQKNKTEKNKPDKADVHIQVTRPNDSSINNFKGGAKTVDDTLIFKKNNEVVVSVNGLSIRQSKSAEPDNFSEPDNKGMQSIIQMFSDDDSLKEIPLNLIDSSVKEDLLRHRIKISYAIEREKSGKPSMNPGFGEITLGIKNPVTYRLRPNNAFAYLLKQIALPILFSILLLAITIAAFIVLYRSLVKQRRLAELKSEFISNITHELKTPISTVGVAIEALKNFNAMDNPARTKEYLDISAHELQRLSLLVDKVLKLSLFETKEMEMNYASVNMKEVVDEVTDSLKLQLEKRNADIEIIHTGDLSLQADRLHLASVVFNLLDNALKYSTDSPKIKIDIEGKENEVVLRIQDNGIGIPAAYKDKVFEKFFRVPHGDTHNAKGYGLGLSYVAKVIEKQGGIITVDSTPGVGSAFNITLPKQHV